METSQSYDFLAGEVMLVDKPLEWTSFDVVKKIRYELKQKLNLKKIKVGHAGTLDPLATGLLVICTGKKTKEINKYMSDDKTYTGVIRLGATTPSYDLETDVDQAYPTDHITSELIEEKRLSFLGDQAQIPPIFSAKKVDGKRAYKAARKGQDIKLNPNYIRIEQFDVDTSKMPDLRFEVKCSKGTYVRSLAHDLGQALGSGAHLIELRRTHSGDLSVENANTVDAWITLIRNL